MPPMSPPPPWSCRLRAVVRVGLSRGRVTALAVVGYADTPVGPYGEAMLAHVRLPLTITVPWMVVDSEGSARAGRAHWGLPKQLAQLELDLDGTSHVGPPEPVLHVRARARGPALPVRTRGVLAQPGHGRAPLRFRGRARAALVQVTGTRMPGGPPLRAGPGVALDGVLRLGAATAD
jgi:hypothetical protein